MSAIYITTQGSVIQRRSGQFLVCKGSEILQHIPEAHVRQFVLFGNVNISTPAVAFCLDTKIDVVFLTQGGRFRGRLNGDGGKSAELRSRQYQRAHDKEFCLTQARVIVAGKISNLIAVARRQNNVRSAEPEIRGLAKAVENARQARSVETLLGIEGAASAAYFKLFGSWMPEPWRFGKRIAHPPGDPVNAMMSLAYTLLYNRMTSHLNEIGLDPYQGFFHTVRYGHAALASDLIEEFRAPLADLLVLKLLRRKQLKLADIVEDKGEFKMKPAASKIFFTEFENKLNSRRAAKGERDLSLTYAQIFKRQAHQIVHVITGENPIYVPFALLVKASKTETRDANC
jgi:CRISPR-associated protein Cas1